MADTTNKRIVCSKENTILNKNYLLNFFVKAIVFYSYREYARDKMYTTENFINISLVGLIEYMLVKYTGCT